MTEKRAALAALAALVVLAGCGADHGTVSSTEYRPAHWTSTTTCRKVGRGMSCTTTPIHHKACWRINFHDERGKAGHDCVSRSAYLRIRVGDSYRK